MSKASEFAERARVQREEAERQRMIAWRDRPIHFGPSCWSTHEWSAEADPTTGHLVITDRTGARITIRSDDALGLGQWIVESYGESPT